MYYLCSFMSLANYDIRWVDLMSPERRKGKGRLHFAASFIPMMELPQAEKKEDEKKEEANKDETSVADGQEPPATPPEEADQLAVADLPESDLHGELIKYTPEKKIDYLGYESGILTVTIHGAKYKERVKGFAEVLVDSNDPQWRTAQIKGVDLPFNETGDAFVKEMDFSRITVRIRPSSDDDKDDTTIGYYTSSVRDIVRRIMEKTDEENEEGETFRLIDSDGATIRLSFKFTPVVNFKLDPRESLESKCEKLDRAYMYTYIMY